MNSLAFAKSGQFLVAGVGQVIFCPISAIYDITLSEYGMRTWFAMILEKLIFNLKFLRSLSFVTYQKIISNPRNSPLTLCSPAPFKRSIIRFLSKNIRAGSSIYNLVDEIWLKDSFQKPKWIQERLNILIAPGLQPLRVPLDYLIDSFDGWGRVLSMFYPTRVGPKGIAFVGISSFEKRKCRQQNLGCIWNHYWKRGKISSGIKEMNVSMYVQGKDTSFHEVNVNLNFCLKRILVSLGTSTFEPWRSFPLLWGWWGFSKLFISNHFPSEMHKECGIKSMEINFWI